MLLFLYWSASFPTRCIGVSLVLKSGSLLHVPTRWPGPPGPGPAPPGPGPPGPGPPGPAPLGPVPPLGSLSLLDLANIDPSPAPGPKLINTRWKHTCSHIGLDLRPFNLRSCLKSCLKPGLKSCLVLTWVIRLKAIGRSGIRRRSCPNKHEEGRQGR